MISFTEEMYLMEENYRNTCQARMEDFWTKEVSFLKTLDRLTETAMTYGRQDARYQKVYDEFTNDYVDLLKKHELICEVN